MGDVQRLLHAPVERGVLRIAVRHHGIQGRGRDGVARREEGDVVAGGDQPLGEQPGDALIPRDRSTSSPTSSRDNSA
jgi:hypothetical protein